MNKPALENYGLTALDLEKAKKIKKWLKVFVVAYAVIGLLILEGLHPKIPKAALIIFVISAAPPFGPLLLYFILKNILLALSPSLKAVANYEFNCISYEKWWVRTKETFWLSLSGKQFEHELANLFRKLGYKADVTSASDDKGVDIWIVQSEQRIPVQCKAHKKPIGPAVAREFYGCMNHFKTKKGILASVSGFTKGVYEFASGKQLDLIDLNWILSKQKKLESHE
jgi:hypothetical protein